MAHPDAKRFWKELLRRRVVRVAVFYIAGAWILAQAIDLLLDAFDASHYMRFVVAGLAVGLPVAVALACVRHHPRASSAREIGLQSADPPAAPESSIAVLPFANLSQT
jgi:transposase-like protein